MQDMPTNPKAPKIVPRQPPARDSAVKAAGRPVRIANQKAKIDAEGKRVHERLLRAISEGRLWSLISGFILLVYALMVCIEAGMRLFKYEWERSLPERRLKYPEYTHASDPNAPELWEVIVSYCLSAGLLAAGVLLLYFCKKAARLQQTRGHGDFDSALLAMRRFWIGAALLACILVTTAVLTKGQAFIWFKSIVEFRQALRMSM